MIICLWLLWLVGDIRLINVVHGESLGISTYRVTSASDRIKLVQIFVGHSLSTKLSAFFEALYLRFHANSTYAKWLIGYSSTESFAFHHPITIVEARGRCAGNFH